ncbi:hypothetical protein Tco_1405832 [Tanacetum coccineum]
MLLRVVTTWVPLPKDILGASSQTPTGCLFPKTCWVPLPKIYWVNGYDMCENTYGYCKNLKKTVKTEQSRTREQN